MDRDFSREGGDQPHQQLIGEDLIPLLLKPFVCLQEVLVLTKKYPEACEPIGGHSFASDLNQPPPAAVRILEEWAPWAPRRPTSLRFHRRTRMEFQGKISSLCFLYTDHRKIDLPIAKDLSVFSSLKIPVDQNEREQMNRAGAGNSKLGEWHALSWCIPLL